MFSTELGSYSLAITIFREGKLTKFLGRQKERGRMSNQLWSYSSNNFLLFKELFLHILIVKQKCKGWLADDPFSVLIHSLSVVSFLRSSGQNVSFSPNLVSFGWKLRWCQGKTARPAFLTATYVRYCFSCSFLVYVSFPFNISFSHSHLGEIPFSAQSRGNQAHFCALLQLRMFMQEEGQLEQWRS